MKTALSLILLTFVLGCNDYRSRDDKTIDYGAGASVIVVNGCQYVIYQGKNSGDFAMVHAGNCDNPQHIVSSSGSVGIMPLTFAPTESLYMVTGSAGINK